MNGDGIISIRKGPTKRERQALNVKVQRQRERIAHLEGVLNSLGGNQRVDELLRLEKDFKREVRKVRRELEEEMKTLREDLGRERGKNEVAVARICRLESVLERVRSTATLA